MIDTKGLVQASSRPCAFCDYVNQILRVPFSWVEKAYAFVFARPSMQVVNDVVLRLALRGRGYNNCCDPRVTGEDKFIRFVSRHEPQLCLDIGANTGRYSYSLLKNTHAQVVAFEPLPKAYGALSNLGVQFPNRFFALNEGVGDICSESELHFGGEDSELASFSHEVNEVGYVGSRNKNTVKVTVNTLDRFFESNKQYDSLQLDLVKIDVEGLEFEVISGAQSTVRYRRPKFIQVEYNWHQLFTGHSLLRIGSLLPNYDLYQILPYGIGLIRRDIRRPENNIFHYSNFVFVRSDITPPHFL